MVKAIPYSLYVKIVVKVANLCYLILLVLPRNMSILCSTLQQNILLIVDPLFKLALEFFSSPMIFPYANIATSKLIFKPFFQPFLQFQCVGAIKSKYYEPLHQQFLALLGLSYSSLPFTGSRICAIAPFLRLDQIFLEPKAGVVRISPRAK